MLTLNLSRRLFLITVVALIPAVLVLGYNLFSLRKAEEDEMHAAALRMAQLVSLEINEVVRGTEGVLRAVGAAPVAERGDAAACDAYVASLAPELPQFVGIEVIDAAGVVRCTPFAHKDVFVGDRSYFQAAVATDAAAVGEYIEGRTSGRPVLPIAVPMHGDGPWAGGVVVATLNLDWLGERLRDRDFAPQSALTIADRNGRILAREPSPEEFVGTLIPDAFQHLVRADAPGTLELTSQDGTRRVIGYFPESAIPEGLYISAGVSTEERFAALDAATLRSGLIGLASLAVALSLAWSTSNAFIRRPVARLLGTIGRWRQEDMTARTGMTGREGELGAVGSAIDEFMDELVVTRESRRQAEAQRELLLGELDHRVKNLVATIQAVARQTFRQSGLTGDASVFLDRMAILSNAHNLLMRHEWQQANMAELVATAVSPFDNPRQPQFEVSGPPFTLNSRAVLALGMALHELSTNALKYGSLRSAAGRVNVKWEVVSDPADGELFRLVWRERDGPPIVPADRKGFGSRMIEQVLAQQIGGEVDIAYHSDGLVCTVTAPVAVVGPQRNEAA